MAACAELRSEWIPARTEQVYQRDRTTISIALRTLKKRGWMTLSWHPQAARIAMGEAPPRIPDTFTFSDQLRHQLNGLALVAMEAIAPWERVLDLQFAKRPGDPPQAHLYVEIMGKYSNVILTDADNLIIAPAHQVNAQQSSVRPILTGQPYEVPPALTNTTPSLQESQSLWQERLTLIPYPLKRSFLKNYRGLSPVLVEAMIRAAGLDPEQTSDTVTQWDGLFQRWQEWLKALENLEPEVFQPGFTPQGNYNVLGWGVTEKVASVQVLIDRYYRQQLNQQEFAQLRHQLSQKLNSLLEKLRIKAKGFSDRLQQSDRADEYRQQADLLMAHLQEWEAGMKSITLADFETGNPVTIPLDPEKNAVQNAQSLYKRHQKLKRARLAVEPLLAEVQGEIDYLEQVAAALETLETYQEADDLETLQEIRDELIQQKYLENPDQRDRNNPTDHFQPHRFQTPNGFEVWIGRNNKQNDQLTFRVATDYDLWFHTQEIPGSHVLLRLNPGSVPDDADLQYTADLTALYSRARQSEQVPVVYTEPKNVYKPKGAKPGIAIYKQERIIWGQPQRVNLGQKAESLVNS